MKKVIHLTDKQFLDLSWGKEIKVKQKGVVLYIQDFSSGLSVRYWSGDEATEVVVKFAGEVLS